MITLCNYLIAGVLACALTSTAAIAYEIPEGATLASTFVGVNFTGLHQAALNDALLQATVYYAKFGADIQFQYWLRNTRGVSGGFAGANEIRVLIVTWVPGFPGTDQ